MAGRKSARAGKTYKYDYDNPLYLDPLLAMDIMPDDKPFDPVLAGRSILRAATVGSLATLDETGHPLATLVTVATLADGRPVLSLSDLALHTKNLKRDPRASLLLVAPGGEGGNPLAGARISLSGRIEPINDEAAVRRHAALHGDLGLADFHAYAMDLERAHLVAGFGRIVEIKGHELLNDYSDCADLLAGEKMIVEHMNEDHRDAIELYATVLLALAPGDWRITGCDPDGIDLISASGRGRLAFPIRAHTVAEAGGHLKTFAKEARAVQA